MTFQDGRVLILGGCMALLAATLFVITAQNLDEWVMLGTAVTGLLLMRSLLDARLDSLVSVGQHHDTLLKLVAGASGIGALIGLWCIAYGLVQAATDFQVHDWPYDELVRFAYYGGLNEYTAMTEATFPQGTFTGGLFLSWGLTLFGVGMSLLLDVLDIRDQNYYQLETTCYDFT